MSLSGAVHFSTRSTDTLAMTFLVYFIYFVTLAVSFHVERSLTLFSLLGCHCPRNSACEGSQGTQAYTREEGPRQEGLGSMSLAYFRVVPALYLSTMQETPCKK